MTDQPFTYQAASGRIRVLQGGRRIGTILREHGTVPHGSGGFYYQPTGSGATSEVFATLDALKQHVEAVGA